MLPKISIITITFNAERYIAQTMDSVAAQGYPDLEYIIVDGGSTDATLSIVRSRSDLVTHLVSEPDQGISDAFNKGIKMAGGEIIGILNADDYYHPGALHSVARCAEQNPQADVFYGNAIYEPFSGEPSFLFKPACDLKRHIWKRLPINHPATFVTREAYARYGLFDLRYRQAMDYDLILRMVKGGARFCHVDEVLAHYRFGQPHWLRGLREVRNISIAHGHDPVRAHWHYAIAVFKANVRQLLGSFTTPNRNRV